MFDVYLSASALEAAESHFREASWDGKEALGLLVGRAFVSEGRPYAVVEEYVTAPNEATAVTVRFSREAFPALSEKLRGGRRVVGWAHCLPSSELILTSEGVLTVFEVFERVSKGNSVRVASLDFISNKIAYSSIASVQAHPAKKLVEVQADLGRAFTGTPDHRLFTLGRNRMGWTPMSDIRVGDFLGVPARLPISKKIRLNLAAVKLKRPNSAKRRIRVPKQLSESLMRFLGLLYSDGHVRERAWIEFSNNDPDLIRLFCRLSRKLFGVDPRITPRENRYRARIFSRELQLFLTESIGFSKSRLPPVVFRASPSQIRAFVSGLIDGDGHSGRVSMKKKERVISICLGADRRISAELVYLLSLIGIRARIRKQKQNFVVRNHDFIYSVSFQESPRSASDQIPFSGTLVRQVCLAHGIRLHSANHLFVVRSGLTRERLKRCLAFLRKRKIKDPRLNLLNILIRLPVNWVKVKSRETRVVKEPVYDFYVPKTFNFFAGSGGPVVSHNSHPDYGCFLSHTDVATQEAFFPEPYHFALVVDPVRREKMCFKVNGGRYEPVSFAVVRKK